MGAPSLYVELDAELPSRIAVGRGTVLFVLGRCFSPEQRIDELTLLVDGEAQPLGAQAMPRLDALEATHPGQDPYALEPDPGGGGPDPLLHSYRSGFWGLARVRAGPRDEVRLALRARLQDGRTLEHELARIAVGELPAPLPVRWPAGGTRVAICMATYNPPEDLLRAQLQSIRAQTHDNWVCVISDDCSDPAGTEVVARAVGDDPRIVVSRSPRRLGFYRNFERALALAPADAQYVALADQDDTWHADKLAALLEAVDGATLAFSDARVVSRSGELVSDTWWNQRRNNHTDLLSVLVANSITGAASLFPRALLDDALPFPPAQFAHFHDHWIGLVALALGRVAYVARPLYDYVQHGEASLGHAGANVIPPSLLARLRQGRPLRERVRDWRLHYYVDACRLSVFAATLDLRLDGRMARSKRRSLRRYSAAERSPLALAGLAARGLREFLGTPETLGAEWMLAHALAWRWLLSASARDTPQRRGRLDALPPPFLALAPGRRGPAGPAREVAEKIAPLRWALADDAPRRVNLLIPTVDLKHFFGGYITKFNLAQRLAQQGCRVRIVTVDPTEPLPPGWRETLESYRRLDGLLQRVELVFGREAAEIECSRDDAFIATTWWTAHIADAARRQTRAQRFVYLIQEYETFTFPMGSYAALADASYRLPHAAMFSSELLREYFRRHSLGVFAAGEAAGERDSISFENAITAVASPTEAELSARAARRLLFYARPEPHAARNMFELGALALSGAVQEGVFGPDWELRGIGTVRRGGRLELGNGVGLTLAPRFDQARYGEVLREHDVGLALMYTPHPSLVPIEMASAGLVTVTNSFENKTPEAMAAISSNLICAEPSVAGVTQALREAVARVGDVGARVRGSAVRWSEDWERSFDQPRMDWLRAALEWAGE